MTKQIILYSRQSCAPCNQLKRFMKLKGLNFIEKPVENPDNAAEAYGYTGMSTVPVTVVEKTDDSRLVITGYNLSKLMPALA